MTVESLRASIGIRKERAAALLAGYVHIDASLQSQFRNFNSYLSEIRLSHE